MHLLKKDQIIDKANMSADKEYFISVGEHGNFFFDILTYPITH